MLKNLLLCLLLISITACNAQVLIFQKNRFRTAYYKKGDVLSFTVKGDDTKFTGQILGFEDDQIVFRFYKINPDEITAIYVDDKIRTWFILRYKYEKLLKLGGVVFLAADLVNTGELSKETLVISGSLILSGFLARWFISDKIRIKGKRKLAIISR